MVSFVRQLRFWVFVLPALVAVLLVLVPIARNGIFVAKGSGRADVEYCLVVHDAKTRAPRNDLEIEIDEFVEGATQPWKPLPTLRTDAQGRATWEVKNVLIGIDAKPFGGDELHIPPPACRLRIRADGREFDCNLWEYVRTIEPRTSRIRPGRVRLEIPIAVKQSR
jgi:hypothetical protein